MPLYGGHLTYPAPLAPAPVVLHLDGPWPVPVVTHAIVRQPSQPRLTLRCRTAGAVTVRVERRTLAHWEAASVHTGAEWSCLVKGRTVRLWIVGNSPGWVELIETRG